MPVRNILIVGGPRSGTSLTATIFTRCGYHVGTIADARQRDGDRNNPLGYFEADDVVAHNVALLQAAGYSHHNTWLFTPIPAATVAAIAAFPPREPDRELIAAYDLHAPWVWKDPRLCFTLGYWWRMLPNDATGVVLVRRDPRAIHRSLVRTGWAHAGDGERRLDLAQLTNHFDTALATVRRLAIPHVTVEYQEYFTRLDEVCGRLAAFTGTRITPGDVPVRRELDHSTLRGRWSGWLLHSIEHGTLRPLRHLRRLVPVRVLRLIVPERS